MSWLLGEDYCSHLEPPSQPHPPSHPADLYSAAHAPYCASVLPLPLLPQVPRPWRLLLRPWALMLVYLRLLSLLPACLHHSPHLRLPQLPPQLEWLPRPRTNCWVYD